MIKEILCMPHSHLDIGYTHPQPLLMEHQADYIDQAMELIEKTECYPEEARFCWTVEANYVLHKWLQAASKASVDRMKQYIKEGRICVTALPMHTTPGVNIREMVYMVSDLKELEEQLDTKIHIALNHDVDGQPWTLGQVMLDSGVDFYLTGVNIHFGGIPFPRPLFFRWEQADGRTLPTFLGEHYSVFSQVVHSFENSTESMQKGLEEHCKWMEGNGYDKEYIFLTATNPPQYDNNCPDWTLPDLVRRYNEEGHEYKVRLVTAQMLQEKLLKEETQNRLQVPVHKGDWTDFWNFGCASTARETRVNRLAKNALETSEMLECFELEKETHFDTVKKVCQDNIMMYDEHTWGSAGSIYNPDGAGTRSQLVHKWGMAYRAADLSGYLLSRQMERCCNNPYQSNQLEGIVLVNPTAEAQTAEIAYPERYRNEERHISTVRSNTFVPYMEQRDPMRNDGILELPPFAVRQISFPELDRIREESNQYLHNYEWKNNVLETPYYTVQIDGKTGNVLQIHNKQADRDLLSQKGYGLFEPLVERIDETVHPAVRETLFGNSVDLRNHNISQWNHDWKAKYTGMAVSSWRVEEQDYSFAIVREGVMDGIRKIEQRILFYTYRSQIRMETVLDKEAVIIPESLLFVTPLKLNGEWKCSYDTAGEVVLLDEEQMGHVCRDYLTVDTAVSMYDRDTCVTLACPDAPMVQTGDFNFGREQFSIPRNEDPLLLAWPMNNYWSTNFMANQDGRHTFAYELNVHSEFSAGEMRKDGVSARKPVMANAVVTVSEKEERLLEYSGNSSILSVFPSKNKDSILILLKNRTDLEDTVSVRCPVWNVKRAFLVTPQEEILEELTVKDGEVKASVLPRALKIISLAVKKED